MPKRKYSRLQKYNNIRRELAEKRRKEEAEEEDHELDVQAEEENNEFDVQAEEEDSELDVQEEDENNEEEVDKEEERIRIRLLATALNTRTIKGVPKTTYYRKFGP